MIGTVFCTRKYLSLELGNYGLEAAVGHRLLERRDLADLNDGFEPKVTEFCGAANVCL